MGNDQPALRALFACESGLSEPEIGLEHAFVLLAKEARQMGEMAKFARCPVCKNNCKLL
jgi:xanthine dehydrogenase iron-sulfur cluster and FAD-binding subunit A